VHRPLQEGVAGVDCPYVVASKENCALAGGRRSPWRRSLNAMPSSFTDRDGAVAQAADEDAGAAVQATRGDDGDRGVQG
jgi:hypothetical protein